jgi:hypothetical protein
MRLLLIHIAFITLAFQVNGQELNLVIDKPEAQIGEPFVATYSIVSDQPIDSVGYNPNHPIFYGKETTDDQSSVVNEEYELEIQGLFSDTSYQEGSEFIWKGKYKLVGWDSAYVVLPPEKVYLNDSLHYFPPALIQITSPQADPSKDIYDINEDFTTLSSDEAGLKAFLMKHWWWILIVLILIIVVVYFKLKGRAKKPVVQLSLREQTLKEIDALEKSKGYEVDLKEFYFDLSILLRNFLAKHYNMRMLDKTTGEIERILATKGLEKSTINLVTMILTKSDMVKFARSAPPVSEVFAVTNEARRVVNEIADLELTTGDE